MTLEESVNDITEWRREVVGETGPLLAAGKMSTEAAEVLDLYIKAEDWPSREVDERHLKQEIGDVFVTIVGICDEAEVTLADCIDEVMQKNTSDDWKDARGL